MGKRPRLLISPKKGPKNPPFDHGQKSGTWKKRPSLKKWAK